MKLFREYTDKELIAELNRARLRQVEIIQQLGWSDLESDQSEVQRHTIRVEAIETEIRRRNSKRLVLKIAADIGDAAAAVAVFALPLIFYVGASA